MRFDRLADESEYFGAIEPYQEEIKELKAYIEQLEEFVRAHLWFENYIANHGNVGWKLSDDFQEHNSRALRIREAYTHMPDRLFDETNAENLILYNDLEHTATQNELDAAWSILDKKGLVNGEPLSTYKHVSDRANET